MPFQGFSWPKFTFCSHFLDFNALWTMRFERILVVAIKNINNFPSTTGGIMVPVALAFSLLLMMPWGCLWCPFWRICCVFCATNPGGEEEEVIHIWPSFYGQEGGGGIIAHVKPEQWEKSGEMCPHSRIWLMDHRSDRLTADHRTLIRKILEPL